MVRFFTLLALCFVFLTPGFAAAQEKTMPATAGAASIADVTVPAPAPVSAYPMIRLTPDKLEIVRFDEDAASVLVGSSKHLNMVLDTPRTAILIPREPGSTSFTVLNGRGQVIMERHVIVASPKQDYVRVRRSCVNADGNKACQEYSVFFCPDMCHKVAVQQDVDPSRVVDVPDVAPANVGAISASSVPDAPAADTFVQDPNLPPPAPEAPVADDNSKLQ